MNKETTKEPLFGIWGRNNKKNLYLHGFPIADLINECEGRVDHIYISTIKRYTWKALELYLPSNCLNDLDPQRLAIRDLLSTFFLLARKPNGVIFPDKDAYDRFEGFDFGAGAGGMSDTFESDHWHNNITIATFPLAPFSKPTLHLFYVSYSSFGVTDPLLKMDDHIDRQVERVENNFFREAIKGTDPTNAPRWIIVDTRPYESAR